MSLILELCTLSTSSELNNTLHLISEAGINCNSGSLNTPFYLSTPTTSDTVLTRLERDVFNPLPKVLVTVRPYGNTLKGPVTFISL